MNLYSAVAASAPMQANISDEIEPTLTPDEIEPTLTPTKSPKAEDVYKGATPTATELVNMTPIPELRLEGWERQALRDLAEVNAWPTTVVYDSAGRLRAQNGSTDTDWTVRAHIRAFDYRAGASAAERGRRPGAG